MNQKPFRTLFLWVLWASTALVVYVSLYRDTGFWDFLKADTSRVTWLIIGLFALGIASSFLLVLVVTFEALAAQFTEDHVRDQGLKTLEVESSRWAVNRFFMALKATIESGGHPDIEALLNVELASYQRMSHSIEVIGNLLITLGLIGTVMGLTLTLTGLTSSLDALGHNQELLLSGLRKAMSGMGTAFYTTLLGAVLGGILLRVFAQITSHGIESLFDKLMRICLVFCSADLRATLERDIRFLDKEIHALGEHIEVLQSAFDGSRSAMAEFKKEISELRELSRQENASLADNIRIRQHNNAMLREEVRLMRSINKPLWVRIREALGIKHD